MIFYPMLSGQYHILLLLSLFILHTMLRFITAKPRYKLYNTMNDVSSGLLLRDTKYAVLDTNCPRATAVPEPQAWKALPVIVAMSMESPTEDKITSTCSVLCILEYPRVLRSRRGRLRGIVGDPQSAGRGVTQH